ncbi:hypothetical protein BELL_0288g00020 [Botrytis elliptica]|uniref:Uncharacterized protein n=1 Tax=Botrytis elliptica TaxID=278938 RepID=A0A4Z1JM07_9HELO|nr:hypothetical protein BELL_0288g00020 [Botrytis elliptica]
MQELYWLRGRRRWMDWDDDAGVIGCDAMREGRGNELQDNRTVFFDSSQGQGQGQKEVRRGALLRHMMEKNKVHPSVEDFGFKEETLWKDKLAGQKKKKKKKKKKKQQQKIMDELID